MSLSDRLETIHTPMWIKACTLLLILITPFDVARTHIALNRVAQTVQHVCLTQDLLVSRAIADAGIRSHYLSRSHFIDAAQRKLSSDTISAFIKQDKDFEHAVKSDLKKDCGR